MTEGTILTVCTGNVCRSPVLEALLQAACDQRFGTGAMPVRSAGVAALAGEPMDARSAAELVRIGGKPPPGFVARQLTRDQLAAARLVLTATREHRAQVARLYPKVMKRTFTYPELADILAGIPQAELSRHDDPDRQLEAVLTVAAEHRGVHQPRSWSEFDIVDPYRRSAQVYAAMSEQIQAATEPLLRGLLGMDTERR